MRAVQLTREALAAIRARATRPFKDTSRPASNGMVECDLDAVTLARLDGCKHAGETLSDTIIRVCALAGRRAH